MIDLKVKELFFDREAVTSVLDRARVKVLNRMGGKVRIVSRRSQRVRKRASKPGEPPSAHNRLLRDNIYYGYDQSSSSVVTGPVRIGKGTAPSVLEGGGKATLVATKLRRGKRPQRVRKTITIAKRPYMGPALQKVIPEFPQEFKDSMVKIG